MSTTIGLIYLHVFPDILASQQEIEMYEQEKNRKGIYMNISSYHWYLYTIISNEGQPSSPLFS